MTVKVIFDQNVLYSVSSVTVYKSRCSRKHDNEHVPKIEQLITIQSFSGSI